VSFFPSSSAVDFGRDVTGRLAAAEAREWLCVNGIGGFAAGTVAGLLTRRYHGLLVAALQPPLARTVLVSRTEETTEYRGVRRHLHVNRWADGTVGPHGYHEIERFQLDGTTPRWSYALADALLEKRIWMEPGANTTYVLYRVARAAAPVSLTVAVHVNYRDYHSTTRGGWSMRIDPAPAGVRVEAFAGARPFEVLAPGAAAEPAATWHYRGDLARERERGLDSQEDTLHAVTFHVTLPPGATAVLVCSAEEAPDLDAEAAWRRRRAHEAAVLEAWRAARPAATPEPAWITQLALGADQFLVSRPAMDVPDGMSVIAGYPWFGDWGRDTMIALPGLLLTTGRPAAAASILRTFARFVDRGMLPNRFPDAGEAPEYNTVDATLWYFEAIRAYMAATGDDVLLRELYPVLEEIVDWHRKGTRYGIAVDPDDGLLRAGEPGVQLTWMDARVGKREITPRTGKPVEINALWFNALRAMGLFARRLRRPAAPWEEAAGQVARSFERFWNAGAGCCKDVIDGPDGDDPAIRPNQILAVSLAASPLPAPRQRQVVDVCAAELLTAFGLRSLSPRDPAYRGRYAGGPAERDEVYHQGTAWGWLLGPFVLAHLRVHGDRAAARAFLLPLAHHVSDAGLGSIAEVFDGDAPFEPGGCPFQAWSVAETLRAWAATEPEPPRPRAARPRAR
jgi:predicted glycogen debranching enzyme